MFIFLKKFLVFREKKLRRKKQDAPQSCFGIKVVDDISQRLQKFKLELDKEQNFLTEEF
jgi:hypothetical protein